MPRRRGVDPVWAAGQVALGAFTNARQICTSVERVLAVMSQETIGPVAAVQVVHSFDAGAAVRESIGVRLGGNRAQGLGYGPELLDELSRVKVVHWEPAPTG